MKKISTILLVLALASTMIFASFSGSATVNLGYNLDTTEYGFINSDSVKASFEFFKLVAEKEGDQDIAVRVKADVAGSWAFGGKDGKAKPGKADYQFTVKFSDITAEIFSGDVWKLGITGMKGHKSYAVSAIEKFKNKDGDKKPATAVLNVPTTAGVYGSVMGFNVSVGAHGFVDQDKNEAGKYQHNVAATFETPDFEFVEGLKTQASLGYGFQANKKGEPEAANHKIGGGVKLSYDVEDLGKVSVASDVYYSTEKINTENVTADASVKAEFDPVTFDLFYASLYQKDVKNKPNAYDKHLLSLKLATDLAKYEVPVTVTLTAKDVLVAQDLSLEVKGKVLEDALTLTADGGVKLNIDTLNKGSFDKSKAEWNSKLKAEYVHEYFTAKAEVNVGAPFETTKDNLKLGASASVESSTLVDGATFGVKYEGAEDLLKIGADGEKELGKVNLFCTIKF